MSQETNYHPGAVPSERETTIAEAPAFVEACMSQISDRAARLGRQLGNPLLTHDEAWELILRVDITFHSPPSSARARLVYWGDANGEILGTAFIPGGFAPLKGPVGRNENS